MVVETTKTVGELAVTIPAAIPMFESLGIDYSCRGNRSLAEASDWAGVDCEELTRELEQSMATAPSQPNWFHRPLTELIGYIIEEHHRFESEKIRAVGDQLVAAVDARCGQSNVIRRLHALFTALTDTMSGHMFHEERELFGRIAKMERASEAAAAAEPWRISVRSLVLAEYVEHDQMAERLRKMREISSNYSLPEDACAECQSVYANLVHLEQALHRHMHLENNVLFPRALELENRMKTNGKIAFA